MNTGGLGLNNFGKPVHGGDCLLFVAEEPWQINPRGVVVVR